MFHSPTLNKEAGRQGIYSQRGPLINKLLKDFFFSFPGHYTLKEEEKNYNEQTKDCISLIYKLRIRVHLLKPEEEECCEGLLKLSCLEPEKSRNQENGESIVYMP